MFNPDDLAVDARGDAPRWLADAATDVQHPHPRPDPGQLADQVSVGIQRLCEGLPAVGKEPEMKIVAEEQPPIVGDQIEVGGDPPHRASAAQQPRQPGARGVGGLPEQLPCAQASRRISVLILSHNR
jgi:hypothetical protein